MSFDFDYLHPEGAGPVSDFHRRIAIVGGDGRPIGTLPPNLIIRIYPCPRYGGAGRKRALFAAIRSTSFDCVLILVRFIDHSTCDALRALCHRMGVRVRLIPNRGRLQAALAAEVAA